MARWCGKRSLQAELLKQGLLKEQKKATASGDGGGGNGEATTQPVPRVHLSFRNVCYSIPEKSGTVKNVLNGVDGWFRPGSLSAIMGPSGCGKSTLLDVLADMKDFGVVSGDIRVNGKPRTQLFRRVAAYVMQNDVLYPNLTTRETLWFVAELRLAHLPSQAEKHAIVQGVIDSLGLSHVADARIGSGDSGGGLSGGQKRRVTVAIELITNPSLIFLDEPTSGLDAYGSLQVVSVLRHLADQGRTVVCTIHQPRSDIFKMFDNLLLMKLGRVMYFGDIDGVLPFFESCGVMVDKSVNPADFIVDLTHDKTNEEVKEEEENLMVFHTERANRPECSEKERKEAEGLKALILGNAELDVFVAIYAKSRILQNNLVQISRMHCGKYQGMPDVLENLFSETEKHHKYTTSFWTQSFTLTRRAFINDIRNPSYLMTWVLGAIMSLFYGMLYSSVISPTISIQSYATLSDTLNGYGTCTQNQSSLSVIYGIPSSQINYSVLQCGEAVSENYYLWLSRSSFLYQLLAANFFSEFPMVSSVYLDKAMFFREHSSRSYSSGAWCFSWTTRIHFSGMIKALFFPPMVYFSGHLAPYAEPYFAFCVFMGAMSLAGSSVAFFCSSAIYSLETASVSFVVINIFAQNLSGYFMYANYIPWWFKWIYYVNFFRYAYEGVVLSQRLTPGQENQDNYALIQEKTWVFAFVSLVFTLGFQILAFFFTWFYYRSVSVLKNESTEAQKKASEEDEQRMLEETEAEDGFGVISEECVVIEKRRLSTASSRISKPDMLTQMRIDHHSQMRGITTNREGMPDNADLKSLAGLAMPGAAPIGTPRL